MPELHHGLEQFSAADIDVVLADELSNGSKRGTWRVGGEVDTERMAKVLLDEYRSCKLGRFTLETPEMLEEA